MDDSTSRRREEYLRLLWQTAEMKVSLDRADGKIQGVPHYSEIEKAAHELGRQISRMVQAMHVNQVVAEQPETAPCPKCGKRCKLHPKKRKVVSGDGPVELQELAGHCPCCRRAFFPSA
jgi:hypothetical protein